MGNENAYAMKWMYIFNNVKTRIRWNGYMYLIMLRCVFGEMDMYIWLCQDTGTMNRPLRLTECFVGVFGMFATYFVGGRCIINNPFRMPSRNVRNVLVICMLHIRRVKVWFLRCKSGFLHAKNPFLFFVSITNTLLMCYEYSVKWLRTFRQA